MPISLCFDFVSRQCDEICAIISTKAVSYFRIFDMFVVEGSGPDSTKCVLKPKCKANMIASLSVFT